jgi:DNA-binding transcriptional LysR family regulator
VCLKEVDEAERAALGEYAAARGTLTITAPIVFGRVHVLPVAMAFLHSHPEIDLRLTQTDRIVDLADERVDVAVRIGVLPDSSLLARPVGAIRRVICGSPDYFAAHGVPRRPADLAKHDCVTFHGVTAPDAWTFRDDDSVAVRSRLVVNTAEAALDAAAAGLGITRVLSYQATPRVRAGELRLVLEKFEPEPWPVTLVYSGQGPMPLKLRAFLDFAVPLLKKRVAEAAL